MTPDQIRARLQPLLQLITAAADGWTVAICSNEQWLRGSLAMVLDCCSLAAGSIAEFLALPLPAHGQVLVICGDQGMDGGADEVIGQLRQAVGKHRCHFLVILQESVGQERLEQIWRCGADALVCHEACGEGQLLQAILLVLRSQCSLDPGLRQRLQQAPDRQVQASAAVALSERERELLLAVARGYSSSKIAVLQHIRSDSVRRALSALYRKVGVDDQRGLVAWGLEQGLLRPLDLRALPRLAAHPATGSRHRSQAAVH